MRAMEQNNTEAVARALDRFAIELPSWGFANTGTRFGKFLQAAAAATLEEKFADAAQVHELTGACPSVALHVPVGPARRRSPDVETCQALERQRRHPARRDQPEPLPGPGVQARLARQPGSGGARRALEHCLESVDIGREPRRAATSRCWFADGSNYPGTANIRERKHWFEEALGEMHARARAGAAAARRVQAVRAGVLSHRHRRLGHGAAARARRRARRPGARRHRSPLPGAEHRADRRVAARRRACSAASTSTTAAMPTMT